MSNKIALLVDAENISYRVLPRILKIISQQGQIILKAVWGDWNQPNLQKWKDFAKENQFHIRHQTSLTQTKNSTDMKLIMDAMDVIHYVAVDTFCLVTNDADYIPLCDKIHEAKKYIVGVGYRHASIDFVRACDQFIFIKQEELPVQLIVPTASVVPVASTASIAPKTPQPNNQSKLERLISEGFTLATSNPDDWVTLSTLGSTLRKLQPQFKPNTYGHSTLSKLLKSLPNFVELKTKDSVQSARLKKHITAGHPNLQQLIAKAFVLATSNTDDWVDLSALGSALRKLQPQFKPNTYGHGTLSKLLKSMPNVVELQTNGTMQSARRKTRP